MNDNKSSDFLVTAYEFLLGPAHNSNNNNNSDWEQDENAWSAYNWNFSECGTTNPTPWEHCATLFAKYQTSGDDDAEKSKNANYKNPNDDAPVTSAIFGPILNEDDDDNDLIRIYNSSSNLNNSDDAVAAAEKGIDDSNPTHNDSSNKPSQFLRGVAYPQEDLRNVSNVNDVSTTPAGPEEEEEEEDLITIPSWTMGVFHVATKQDYEFACQLEKEDPFHRVVLKHEQTSHSISPNLLYTADHDTDDDDSSQATIMVCVTTGMAPTAVSPDDHPDRFRMPLSDDNDNDTTAITIAKCHLSYRDNQWDPWIGPCIEAMSVNPQYRGHGWLWVLWYQAVFPFLQQHYTVVEDNDASVDKDNDKNIKSTSIQVRVIHLLGSELDHYYHSSSTAAALSASNNDQDNKKVIVWDQDFYFGQIGFSILPRGERTGVMNYLRPHDDQGIGYLSLKKEETKGGTTLSSSCSISSSPGSMPIYLDQL
ncbi:unnamed protein product [Cylindrotheca closterium]|uniref:Uncharacterized protein n=1 Tax=Cylindrotheca closterium TaxID=2856 RepID=A0AAD2JMQ2_9STRA|nr:unnamed protein product [Cylindrotheca closterium]